MIEIPNVKPNTKPNNNYNQKKEEDDHRVKSVVKNNSATKMKATSLQKFAKAFVPEDAKSVKDYVVEEAPGLIQSFLRRLLQNLLDTYLPDKGLYSAPRRFGNGTSNTTVRYDAIRTSNASGSAPVRQRNSYSVYEYENVIFDNYEDARDALDELFDCLSRYEKVRVFDLYEAASMTTRVTDRDYGWVDLTGVNVYPTDYIDDKGQKRSGWYINLPRAIALT